MIRNLAYIGFESPAAAEWSSFGAEVLGAQDVSADDDAVRLRVDRAPWHIAVAPGASDALSFLGWDVGDDEGLRATSNAVEADGLTVHQGDAVLCADRAAASVAWFVDHVGIRHELAYGRDDVGEFVPGRPLDGEFVTGTQGFGHVVLIVPDVDEGFRFATEVLGMRLSDTIQLRAPLYFFHCEGRSSRHHSLAISGAPGHVGVHHLMLELSEPNDVGRALDLVRDREMTLAMDYGHHPNDQMTSFYVRGPSGFEIEYGSGGVVIDDDAWEPATYDRMSIWGHRPPADGPLRPGIIRRIETGAST